MEEHLQIHHVIDDNLQRGSQKVITFGMMKTNLEVSRVCCIPASRSTNDGVITISEEFSKGIDSRFGGLVGGIAKQDVNVNQHPP